MRKVKKGRKKGSLPVVRITFIDHSSGGGDAYHPIECQVFGLLYNETDVAYYVCSWVCGYDVVDANSEGYCILKSAITDLRLYTR